MRRKGRRRVGFRRIRSSSLSLSPAVSTTCVHGRIKKEWEDKVCVEDNATVLCHTIYMDPVARARPAEVSAGPPGGNVYQQKLTPSSLQCNTTPSLFVIPSCSAAC